MAGDGGRPNGGGYVPKSVVKVGLVAGSQPGDTAATLEGGVPPGCGLPSRASDDAIAAVGEGLPVGAADPISDPDEPSEVPADETQPARTSDASPASSLIIGPAATSTEASEVSRGALDEPAVALVPGELAVADDDRAA